jgi:tetratricopeptide (TPR) repeat protein
MHQTLQTTTISACAALLVASLTLPAAPASAGVQQLDPIAIETSRFQWVTYALPRQTPPAADVETLPRPVKKPFEAWKKSVGGADEAEARADLLEALRKQSKKLDGDGWLLRGRLLEAQAEADYDAAMAAYAEATGDEAAPQVDLATALAAYQSATDTGSPAVATWAHYATGVSQATEDAAAAVAALQLVAESDAVPGLQGEALVRIAEIETDPARSEEALRQAAEVDNGKFGARAALGLAHAALKRSDPVEALSWCGKTLDGPAFDGDHGQALAIAVRTLVGMDDDFAGNLPDGLSPERKADVLIELGEFWMSATWGVHPAEALRAFEQAMEVAPGAAKVRGAEKKRDAARELAKADDEGEGAYLERVSRLCYGMALATESRLEVDADLHLIPGKKGAAPTLEAEVFAIKDSSGSEMFGACLTGGQLPAPLNPKPKETKVTVKLTGN